MARRSPDAGGQVLRGAGGAALVVVLAMLLGACSVLTGSPASTPGWRSDTDEALGSATSSLGTARVLLENEDDGRLPHAYVVVAARDALTNAEKETSAYRRSQPPPSEHERFAEAVAAIDDSLSVLSSAAAAMSSDDAGARRRALQAVRAQYDRVEALRAEVAGS